MMSDHNSSDLAPQRQEMSVENVSSGLVPQGQKASDSDNSDPVPPRQNVVPSAEKTDSSQHGKTTMIKQPNASFQEDEFINPFCTRIQEIGESSSRNIDNTDVHSFQPQSHDYRWTRDHPLEQVRGNPSMPVQTRRQLATDPEMCMFALTAKYALEILQKHNMDNCHSIGTPLATKPKLDVDLSGEPVDQSDYRSKIGSLMYLTSSRPDLVQAICYCARYQARPTQKHLKEPDGLDTRKSTSGGIQFHGDKLVSGCQETKRTAMSFSREEYVRYLQFHNQSQATSNNIHRQSTSHTRVMVKYLVRRIGMRCLTPAELEVLTNETA
ncbi:hypothetical protein Tco_1110210 [Tanacetum coccineum]|uniref:Reverse transcriptase Ty1/copia-type domain-containing protein n=1 Tax=Tanacetum coccineum TaxID=301880 RepID=A0ABQ5II53_9ASTR